MNRPLPQTNKSLTKGFTLIEIFVTISLVAILLALMIPFAKRTLASSRSTASASNLRQIGAALLLYASENENRLPRSDAPGNWYFNIDSYLGGSSAKPWDPSTWNRVFICPARKLTDHTEEIPYTYAAHPLLVPSIASRPSISLASVARPSEVMIVADAIQRDNTRRSSHSTLATISGPSGPIHLEGDPSKAKEPIATGPDVDPDNAANIRYRHNGAANILFVDGHVERLRKGEIKEANIRLNY